MKPIKQRLLHWPRRLMSGVSYVVLLTFGASVAHPTVVAAQAHDRQQRLLQAPVKSALQTLDDEFVALEQVLDRLHRRVEGRFEHTWQEITARSTLEPPPARATPAQLHELTADVERRVPRIAALQADVKRHFDDTEAMLRLRRAPAVAIDKLLARRAQYEDRYRELARKLDAVTAASTTDGYAAAVTDAHDFLAQHSSKPARAVFDPALLAFGPPKERARKPVTDPLALRQAIGAGAATLTSTAPPTATDLAATEDAQLTPAIVAKANELNRQPLAIYQWVRNNVAFMPTYGSIQGSDHLLKTKRGNAFDQASLLIALLRASNIHARYVYGVVDVPIAQVRNWVGNVETPEAALELLAQGGIPAVGIVEGGVITKVQMEHVWVDAYVDYVPSRGARHVTGDTWIPMDPSFKQFDYTAGAGILESVAFDGAAAYASMMQQSESNEAEGWMRNVNGDAARAQADAFALEVKNRVVQMNPDATVDQVLGAKSVRNIAWTYFPSTLATPVIEVGTRTAELPQSLRWKTEIVVDGQTLLGAGLPSIVGKSIDLQFVPSTDADKQMLQSYFGSAPQSPDDLPGMLPAGDAGLTATLLVDGTQNAQRAGYLLGDDVAVVERMYRPGFGWESSPNVHVAGEYVGIFVDAVGTDTREVVALKTIAEDIDARGATDPSVITPHAIMGTLTRSILASYFRETTSVGALMARASGIVTFRLPSIGSTSTKADVTSFLGIPIAFASGGMIVDIDQYRYMRVHKGGDAQIAKRYSQLFGQTLSHHEHEVLEAAFFTPSDTPRAASSMKALSVANASGQKLYSIGAQNVSIALSQANLPEAVETDIANAVAAGHRVYTHEAPLDYAGNSIVGYIIEDVDTGTGTYRIASGHDGAEILLVVALALFTFALLLFMFNPALWVLCHIMVAAALLTAGCALSIGYEDDRFVDVYALLAGGFLGVGIIGSIVAGMTEAAAALVGWLLGALGFEIPVIISNLDDFCADGPFPEDAALDRTHAVAF